jgi:GNAT superfamily N-acetyltransferase
VTRISSKIETRRLDVGDLPCLLELSRCAGWNQTVADWKVLLDLEPDSCLGVEEDGCVRATATLICYGTRLAWLGMVLTHPDYWRRGFARSLVGSCLEIAAARRIATVKLDATDSGLPLYESLGFLREQTIERWSGHGIAGNNAAQSTVTETLNYALDSVAFGADRSTLLSRLVVNGRSRASEAGFAMNRPGAHAEYLGPCVARSKEAARGLIENCLSESSGVYLWDLLPANRTALELATEFGFRSARKLMRMRKGEEIRGDESMVYAAGGFELG